MPGCVHDADHECSSCFDDRHASEHPEPTPGCLACKLETLQLSPKINPSEGGGAAPAGNKNSWERGVVRDGRGVPLLDGSGEPIGVKRYSEQRHAIEAQRRRLASDPDPFHVKASA